MTVQELLINVRYQINDTDAIEYSDAELISYVNEALRWISNVLISLSCPLLLKKVELTLTDGQASLPDDFVKDRAVTAVINGIETVLESKPPELGYDKYSYTIVGSTLYSDNDSVNLLYYAPYSSVASLTDELLIPDSITNLLQQIVVFLALNRNEFNTSVEQALMQNFYSQVALIASQLGNGQVEPNLPWTV